MSRDLIKLPTGNITTRDDEEENRKKPVQKHLEKKKKTDTSCCSIFGRLADCLLKYCPVAVGLERGTVWQ